MIPDKLTFTITEAARLAGVSRPTVYKALEDGTLKASRIWSRGCQRISREELLRWVQPKSDAAA